MFEEKIHVVFNAKEHGRITEYVVRSKADRVYYFSHYSPEQSDKNESNQRHNLEVLRETLPSAEVIERRVNYTDYFAIIQAISKIVRDEREKNPNNQIFINLGTGSKITAIAGLDAAKLWAFRPYYVYSHDYDPERNPVHAGEMQLFEIPQFKIDRPDPVLVKALKIIAELGKKNQGMYKKTFIETLDKRGLLVVNSQSKRGNNQTRRKSALYMAANHQFLDPLETNWHYIEVSDRRRNQKIFLTEKGREALKIFKFYSGAPDEA